MKTGLLAVACLCTLAGASFLVAAKPADAGKTEDTMAVSGTTSSGTTMFVEGFTSGGDTLPAPTTLVLSAAGDRIQTSTAITFVNEGEELFALDMKGQLRTQVEVLDVFTAPAKKGQHAKSLTGKIPTPGTAKAARWLACKLDAEQEPPDTKVVCFADDRLEKWATAYVHGLENR